MGGRQGKAKQDEGNNFQLLLCLTLVMFSAVTGSRPRMKRNVFECNSSAVRLETLILYLVLLKCHVKNCVSSVVCCLEGVLFSSSKMAVWNPLGFSSTAPHCVKFKDNSSDSSPL